MTEKRKDYLSWDESFMHIADVMSQRSKDPNTQSGSIIVDSNGVIVGLGYNGFPRGIADEDLPWEREGGFLDTKYAYVVHSEENAIYNSNKPTDGCKIYCTMFPCNECAKTLIQSGIKEIIYNNDQYHDTEIWQASRKLFDMAGIKYRQFTPEYELKLEKKNG